MTRLRAVYCAPCCRVGNPSIPATATAPPLIDQGDSPFGPRWVRAPWLPEEPVCDHCAEITNRYPEGIAPGAGATCPTCHGVGRVP